MTSNVFEYTDYRKYLLNWIDSRSSGGRGERSRIAEVLRCHVAYVSRVLGGDADLSPEQAHSLSHYLGHLPEESDFFLLLVQYARAGTKDLRDYYLSKIRSEIERKSVLKNRLDFRKTLPEVEQATFFSSWYYSAVHLLLTMPEFQTEEALVRHLRLSRKKVNEVLRFLLASGLATEKRGKYTTGPTSIHLGNDSPMISKHHINWRMQAIQSIERERPEELHYSSAVTLKREDLPEVRKILISAIEQIRAVVRNSSPDDSLFCYALDLFEVGGQQES